MVSCDRAWGTSFPGTWCLGAGTETLSQSCAISIPRPGSSGASFTPPGTSCSPGWIPWRVSISAPVMFHGENVSQQSCRHPGGTRGRNSNATPRAIRGSPIAPVTLQHLHPMGHLTPITAQTPHVGQTDKPRSGAQLGTAGGCLQWGQAAEGKDRW